MFDAKYGTSVDYSKTINDIVASTKTNKYLEAQPGLSTKNPGRNRVSNTLQSNKSASKLPK